MRLLRTPDERFENLPGFPYEPHYVEAHGIRMHYIDVGDGDPVLCLHGEPSWSYLYRKMVPRLSRDHRVIAPDLIGFGRSDKPAERSDYTYALHYDALVSFVTALDLQCITLVCQDWGGLLGLPLVAEHQDRFIRLVIMNTGLPDGKHVLGPGFMRWREMAAQMQDMPVGAVLQMGTVTDLPDTVRAAYDAPFPNASYKSGAHQFPLLVPLSADDEAVPYMRHAKEVLAQWKKPALVLFSDRDPVTGGGDRVMRDLIPAAKEEAEITIRDAGHYLQEDKGEEIAGHIAAFLQRRPV